MTVSTTTTRASYAGNGVQDEFDFTFKIYESSHLEVYVDGVLRTEDTHYTVSLSTETYTGSITFTAGNIPADESQVLLIRVPPLTQGIDYTENDSFPAETHERGLDLSAIRDQYLKEILDRCIKLAISSSYSGITIPDPVADQYLKWKSDLSGLENVNMLDLSGYGVSDFMRTVLDDTSASIARTTLGLGAYHRAEWYGAVGDGIADDTAALQAALNSGNSICLTPGARYKITSPLVYAGNVSLSTMGFAPAVIEPQTAITGLDFRVTATGSTTLNGEVEIGDVVITVTDATDISSGDLVVLKSDTAWYWVGTEYKGEVHVVKSKSGNDLTLYEPICDNYAVTETVAVTAYPNRTVNLSGITVEYPSALAAVALYVGERQHARISNFNAINCYTGKGIYLEYCYDTQVDKVHTRMAAGSSASTSYGIQTKGSVHTKIINSHFCDCRRGVDFSGDIPSRFGLVSACTASQGEFGSGYAAFGMHETAENILFTGNTINGFTSAFTARGNNIVITGNQWNAPIDALAFVNAAYGSGLVIDDNAVLSIHAKRSLLTDDRSAWGPHYFVNLYDDTYDGEVWIRNNTVHYLYNHPINGGNAVTRWHVTGNYFRVRHDAADNIYLINATSLAFEKSQIWGNDFWVDVGVRYWFRSTTTINWNTCEIDCWDLPDADDLVVYTGSGTLTNKTVDLMIQISRGVCRVSGYIKFDVSTNTAAIKLNNIPRSHGISYYNTARYSASEFMLYITAGDNMLYISAGTAAYNTPFAVGTNYQIPIDIRYKIAA